MATDTPVHKDVGELDLAIIEKLQTDARRPFGAIADELGLPESTVRKRVRRLESAGILRFAGSADPLRLGFQYWCCISIDVELKAVEAVTQALANFDEVFFVAITTGEHNLFVAGVFRSNEDLLRFLTVRLARMPGVMRTSTSNVLRLVKRTGHIFSDAAVRPDPAATPEPEPGNGEAVDATDLAIIRALQADGRMAFSQLASQLDIAASTVQARVSRLRRQGILQFEAFADPLRLGYQIWTLLKFRTDPGQSPAVAGQLAGLPELFFVGILTGESDILCGGVFRSNEDLLSFLTQRVASLDAIRGVSMTNVLRLVKRQITYPLLPTTTVGDAQP